MARTGAGHGEAWYSLQRRIAATYHAPCPSRKGTREKFQRGRDRTVTEREDDARAASAAQEVTMAKKVKTENVADASGTAEYQRDALGGHAFVEQLFQNAEWHGPGPSLINAQSPSSPEQAMELAREGKLRPWQTGYNPDAAMHAFSQTRQIHDRLYRIEEMLKYLCRKS